jgi:hypothetical protein
MDRTTDRAVAEALRAARSRIDAERSPVSDISHVEDRVERPNAWLG